MDKKGVSKSLIVLGVLVAVVAIGFLYVYMTYFKAGPLSVLYIDQGLVQYKSSGGWADAKNGMALKQGDSVKTLEDAKAKIIFSDSVTRLDANTEVSLDELSPEKVSLSQSLGRTWTRLLKISGIKDYEIKTPDAIASVRGTGFGVDVKENGTEVEVGEGNVNVDSGKEEIIVSENKEITLEKDESGLKTEELKDEDGWISGNEKLDEEYLEDLKSELLDKYDFLISRAQSQQGLTDEQVDELVDGWLAGEYSIKEAIENGQVPEGLESIIPEELKRY